MDKLFVWSADTPDGSGGTGKWINLGSDGITNLGYTAGVSNGVVTSDTGDNATIPLADGTNAGLFSAAEKTKLSNIEANAKDDQNASEVPSNASGNLAATNVQDALEELQGDIDTINAAGSQDLGITHNASTVDITIDNGDDITLLEATTNEAGALSSAKFDEIVANTLKETNVTTNISIDQTSETQVIVGSSDGTNGTISAASTSQAGVMTKAMFDKLNGIDTSADVTDATTVNAAGAVMNTDTTTASMDFVIDEDNMVSDLSTKVPTQQSVKAYVDAEIANAVSSEMSYQGAYDASANPSATASKGDTFTVSVAGTGVSNYWSTSLSIGDMIIAEIDNPSSEADWTEVNKNIPDIVNASTTAKGIVELATQTEVNTGTDTTRAITPSRLRSTLGITSSLSTTLTYSELIGDGSNTSIVVTHSIGNQFVQAQVFEVANMDKVECEIELTSSTTTTFKFNVAPASNALRVVIIG